MRFSLVMAVLARLNFFLGLTMAFPIIFAVYDNGRNLDALTMSMVITLSVSLAFCFVFKAPKEDISHREGFIIVALGWASVGFFGALPFFLSKMLGPMNFTNFINCYFESISGFTTTGASVLGATVSIESLGKGILFWRSLTHWLGGMGIIVLAVAILPLLGVGGNQLFNAESPGPTKDKLRPRIRETAATLWIVYAALTVIEILLLMFAGLSFFDAICQSFATLSGGGFSTRDASISSFHSISVDVIILAFMICGGINFSLHYLAFTGKPLSYLKNSEFKYFAAIVIVTISVVSSILFLTGSYGDIFEALRYASFQVVSIITTTGFTTADYSIWPFATQMILMLLMFIGACSGSTSGSVKVVRIVLLFKYAYREIFRLIHPSAFASVKLGGKVVQKDIMESVSGFFLFYIGIFAVASLIMTTLNVDIITSMSSVAASLGNVGPGLGKVGPMENYFAIPTAGKALLTFCMILGRLEIYTVLILLVPAFWKK